MNKFPQLDYVSHVQFFLTSNRYRQLIALYLSFNILIGGLYIKFFLNLILTTVSKLKFSNINLQIKKWF